VLAGTAAGLELHCILDICVQAVAHGQGIRQYRKLKKISSNNILGVNALTVQVP
jgi:hypothetical protein